MTPEDLKQFAAFNKIVMNYLKMKKVVKPLEKDLSTILDRTEARLYSSTPTRLG